MDARRLAGAIGGGLIAGLGITALLMRGERSSGQPSELVALERAGAQKLGLETPAADTLPSAGEQAVVQGGHLLLSVAAGAAYAVATDEDTGVVTGGIAFGLAFYGAMHWVAGPLLGLKKPEWQSDAKTIGMHTMNHVVFGLITAAAANRATKF